jgi:carbon monoxide dehydrogenase subunit G
MAPWFVALGMSARAEPAPVQVGEDGDTVVAVGLVAASPDAVRAALSDPTAMRDLFPDVLKVQVAPDGSCQDVRRETRGLWSPLHLHVRRCPTSAGYREDLVPGDGSFEAYTAEWRLTPTDAGTRVEYRVHLLLSLPVPRVALISNLEAASRQAVQRLVARCSPASGKE